MSLTVGAQQEHGTGSGLRAELLSPRLLYLATSLVLFCPLLVWFYWPAGHGLDVTGHPIDGFYRNMMISGVAAARMLGLTYQTGLMIQAALTFGVLAAACWAVRATPDPHRRTFVLASAAPLVTPYAHNHDLTALAAVVVWRLCRPLPPSGAGNLLLFLAWIIPLLAMHLNWHDIGIAPIALLAVFALSVHEAGAKTGPIGLAAR